MRKWQADERICRELQELARIRRKTLHHEDGNVIIKVAQDVTPTVEACKAAQNARSSKAVRRYEGDLHHVASVPEVIYTYWKNRGYDLLQMPAEDIDTFLKHHPMGLNGDAAAFKLVPWRL